MRPVESRGAFAFWGWPIGLGLLTLIGLVAALFSDGGVGDWLAAVCLAVPVLVGAWHGWPRRADRATAAECSRP